METLQPHHTKASRHPLSTASPLPLQPLPPSTLSAAEARAFKQEVASKLAEHRQRRPRPGADAQAAVAVEKAPRNRIASSVAARFSQRVSYRDFLQQEAEAAIHQAEAEAEVARRTADAIVAAQQELLDEIEHWNARAAEERGPADVIAMTAPAEEAHAVAFEAAHAVAFEAAPAVALEAAPALSLFGDLDDVVDLSVEAVTLKSAPVARVRSKAAKAVLAESAVEVLPEVESASAVAALPELSAFARLLTQMPVEPQEPSVPLPTNLIEFPRQLIAARRARPRLAEGPLRDEADATPERAQLRIFEVEASSVSTVPEVESLPPDWHAIRLGAHEYSRDVANAGAEISFALPMYVAPRSLRAMAALVDGCCVATGFLLAVAAAACASPDLPTGLPALVASGVAIFAFWLIYQFLFFTLGDATPGMRYARIGLCTFNDENPSRASIRRRIGARLLAGMPLGLGLLWACLDEEGLGWHDRISRMYPRAY